MKRPVVILLSAALALCLAGCSKKPAQTVEEPPQKEISEYISEDGPLSEPSYPDASGYEDTEPESEYEPEPPEWPEPPESQPAPSAPAPAPQPVPESPAPGQSVSSAADTAQSEVPERLEAVKPDIGLDGEKIELELLRLINGLRIQAGAESLGIQENMRFAARIRSAEALESFSHTRPNGTPYNTAFSEAGFDYAGKWHGENISSLRFTEGMFDEAAVALEMFNSLKDSPGHYRNMVSENFVQAGIGISARYAGGMVSIASAQLFSSL